MTQARRGYQPIDLKEPDANRLQVALATYLADVEARVEALVSPAVLVATKDALVVDQVLVDYRGPGGHTIMLPLAAVRGNGRAALVHIANNGEGPITVAAGGRDRLNGARTVELAAGGVLTALGNGRESWSAGALIVDAPVWSPVDNANYHGVAAANAQNVATGCKFSVSRPRTLYGVRFYYKSVGGARTIRNRVYDQSTSERSVEVAVNASGVYEGIFSTPFELDAYQGYSVTCYDTSGVNYTAIDATATGPNSLVPVVEQFPFDHFCRIRTLQISASGDVVPGSINTSLWFPIEPILNPYNLIDGSPA